MSVTVTKNWSAAMNEIADAIILQRIDDIGDDVSVQTTPFDSKQVRPGCYVTPTERVYKRPTTSRSTVGYGCMVSLIRGSSRRRSDDPSRVTGWQEVVARLFHDKRLWSNDFSSGTTCLPCKVEDETPLDPLAIQKEYPETDVTSLVVRVWLRETRT